MLSPDQPTLAPVATTATSPNTTIVGYARVVTKYGDCYIIDYSATTRYKDYSVTECDDCIVTRFNRVSNETWQSTAISKASLYQTTSLSLDRIQIDLQESMGRRLRQQWRTRSIDRFDDLDPFLSLFVFYSFDYTVKSGGVCNRLPDLAYYPVSQDQHHPRMSRIWLKWVTDFGVTGSTFMYLYHLISIDLQLSRSFNTHTLQLLQ